jgi:hypothetical protein
MKKAYWFIILICSLIITSVTFYFIQISIFENPRDTFFYMFQDLAFVPLQALLVTFILDGLLKKRDKQALLNKMNMVIGVFFHEVGTELFTHFRQCTQNYEELSNNLKITTYWTSKDFNKKIKHLKFYPYEIQTNPEKLQYLMKFFQSKRECILSLLGNPNLLEHDTFTDLLLAVSHLSDELYHRKEFTDLNPRDLEHLKNDLIRAYKLLVSEWLSYMKHLKTDYPYLYSIALRTNPFNPEAKIQIQ